MGSPGTRQAQAPAPSNRDVPAIRIARILTRCMVLGHGPGRASSLPRTFGRRDAVTWSSFCLNSRSTRSVRRSVRRGMLVSVLISSSRCSSRSRSWVLLLVRCPSSRTRSAYLGFSRSPLRGTPHHAGATRRPSDQRTRMAADRSVPGSAAQQHIARSTPSSPARGASLLPPD